MADTKISALSAAGAMHTDDLLVVVDTHDTSMAASGTDKRLALAQLFAALTGDVAYSGFAGTIANNAVTDAKMATGTANTLAGYDASGAFSGVAVGSGLSLSAGTLTATGGGGSGTVTSVGLTVPSIFSVSGSPIATSGTLAVALADESANVVFAGPATGTAAVPTFRALVPADLPTGIPNANLANPAVTVTAGAGLSGGGPVALGGSTTLSIAAGGVGTTQLAAGAVTAAKIADGTANALMGFDGAGAPTAIVAGSGIAISGGTIAATTGGGGTVTSVGLAVPPGFSVSGSPVATSGTLAITSALSGIIQCSAGAFSAVTVGSGLSFSGGILSATGGGGGTVTSVAMTVPSWLTVSGSPVTASGTLAVAAAGGQPANRVLATPDGTTGAAGLRALASGDFAAGVVPNSALANSSITIAGHAVSLGGSQSLAASDVGLGSVTNDVQAKASIHPNTAPSAGQVLVGNAGGTAYAPVSVSGDGTLSSAGALTIANSAITSAKINAGAVTNAKMATSTANSLAGYDASGNFGTVTAGSGISISGGTIAATAGGGGTVTSVSVASANGFAGTVATATTTPAVTLSTTVTGLLKGDGTAVSAATAGTDYLTGNQTITLSGAVSGSGTTSITTLLASIADKRILANTSGSIGSPVANTLTGILDACIGNTQGDLLYRSASGWAVLAPGTSGQVLTTGGAAADPSWQPAGGTGTVTSVATGTGLTGGPITTTGTVSLAVPVTAANGGTGQTTYATGDLLYAGGATAISRLAGNTSTTKNFLTSTGTGSGANAPSWGAIAAADVPAMVASGASHAAGICPDPGSTAGTTRFLREDATWAIPAGGGGGSPGGSSGQLQYNNAGAFAGAANLTVGSSGQLNFGPIAAPGSPTDGDEWNDSGQGCRAYRNGGLTAYRSHLIYAQNATPSVSANGDNSLVSTTSATGTVSLPAGYLNALNRTVRITARGYATSGASGPGTGAWYVKLGSTYILCATGTGTGIAASKTNVPWWVDAYFTVKATGVSGKVDGGGYWFSAGLTSNSLAPLYTANGSPMSGQTGQVAIDLTAALTLDFGINLSAVAGTNTFVCTNLTAEVLA